MHWPVSTHSGNCTVCQKHTRSHPNFAQIGVHQSSNPQGRGVCTFENPLPSLESRSLLRAEATGCPGNALPRKSAAGSKTSRHKSSCSVAMLPGLGRIHTNKQTTTQYVERGIKIERIMQGVGSGRGDGEIKSDQENHQKPSRMPAYI